MTTVEPMSSKRALTIGTQRTVSRQITVSTSKNLTQHMFSATTPPVPLYVQSEEGLSWHERCELLPIGFKSPRRTLDEDIGYDSNSLERDALLFLACVSFPRKIAKKDGQWRNSSLEWVVSQLQMIDSTREKHTGDDSSKMGQRSPIGRPKLLPHNHKHQGRARRSSNRAKLSILNGGYLDRRWPASLSTTSGR